MIWEMFPIKLSYKYKVDILVIKEEQLCKHIKYEALPAVTRIFKEGELSNDKFYVILKGTVSVVKKRDVNIFQEENERKAKGYLKRISKENSNIEAEFIDWIIFSYQILG